MTPRLSSANLDDLLRPWSPPDLPLKGPWGSAALLSSALKAISLAEVTLHGPECLEAFHNVNHVVTHDWRSSLLLFIVRPTSFHVTIPLPGQGSNFLLYIFVSWLKGDYSSNMFTNQWLYVTLIEIGCTLHSLYQAHIWPKSNVSYHSLKCQICDTLNLGALRFRCLREPSYCEIVLHLICL